MLAHLQQALVLSCFLALAFPVRLSILQQLLVVWTRLHTSSHLVSDRDQVAAKTLWSDSSNEQPPLELNE